MFPWLVKGKRMTLSSFQHYFYCLNRLGLVERTGRKEPASMPHLADKVFWRITDKGRVGEEGGEDPVMALYSHYDRRKRSTKSG
jgi:hypothetical protein